jgi:uncharacterized membrane protein
MIVVILISAFIVVAMVVTTAMWHRMSSDIPVTFGISGKPDPYRKDTTLDKWK